MMHQQENILDERNLSAAEGDICSKWTCGSGREEVCDLVSNINAPLVAATAKSGGNS